uniref:Peptidoglycan recognition protein family domain-containing protein n=1 Tax=Denticeps clupeoides TaxID=299321 RepID=A0AAY4AWP6_9TELE
MKDAAGIGAHTYGYESKGYGIAFIGDYMTSLPFQHSQQLVRDPLTQCAVSAGRLMSIYILHGHREPVDTSCPGDAFYSEIRTWSHFEVCQPLLNRIMTDLFVIWFRFY